MNIKQLKIALDHLNENKIFQFFIIGVIIFSALLIGVKTYDIDPLYLNLIAKLDTLITFSFLFEIIVRFIAAGHTLAFFRA